MFCQLNDIDTAVGVDVTSLIVKKFVDNTKFTIVVESKEARGVFQSFLTGACAVVIFISYRCSVDKCIIMIWMKITRCTPAPWEGCGGSSNAIQRKNLAPKVMNQKPLYLLFKCFV